MVYAVPQLKACPQFFLWGIDEKRVIDGSSDFFSSFRGEFRHTIFLHS